MAEKRKLTELSIMTGFLCCFVVMIHLTSAPLGSLEPGSSSHTFIYVLNKSLSFVVPGFLFLSGLKLTYSHGSQPFVFRTFFTKRFTKILIPYVFWYAAYYGLFRYLGYIEPKTFLGHIYSFLMGDLVAPFYFITIVFQFYLLFGLLLYLFRKFQHNGILLGTLALEYIYLQYTYLPNEDRFFATYLIYFVLGCYGAYHLEGIQRFMKKYWPLVYGLFLFVLVWHVFHGYQSAYHKLPYPYWRLIGCGFSIGAIYSIYHFSYVLSTVLPKIGINAFLWLDRASFGVFLCHSFLIYIYNEVWTRLGIATIGSRFVLNTVLVYPMAFLIIIGYILIKKRAVEMSLRAGKM